MRSREEKAKAELERLKALVTEARDQERVLERQQVAAAGEVKEASEALAAAYAEGGNVPKAAAERLRRAQEAAARPFGEMREGARRRTLRAQGEVEAFACERSADLWAEYEPRARAGAAKVDRLLQEAREAIRELGRIENEANQLLALQNRQVQGSIPRRGLERLAQDLKGRLATPTPPPIPRPVQSSSVESPPEAPGAWVEA
jgi:hypothetical protein